VGYNYLPPLLLQVDEREEASMGRREDSELTLRERAKRLEGAGTRENAELRSTAATLEGSAMFLSRSSYLEEEELGASELDER
jgi:hypothetical protein